MEYTQGLHISIVCSLLIALYAAAGTLEYSYIESDIASVNTEELDPELVRQVDQFVRLK